MFQSVTAGQPAKSFNAALGSTWFCYEGKRTYRVLQLNLCLLTLLPGRLSAGRVLRAATDLNSPRVSAFVALPHLTQNFQM
jgi:hypothetical protein